MRHRHPEPEKARSRSILRNLREARYISDRLPGDIAELYFYDGKVAIVSGIAENYMLVIGSCDLRTLLVARGKSVWERASRD